MKRKSYLLEIINGVEGISDMEHVANGNRAGRRQRSEGSWREHGQCE